MCCCIYDLEPQCIVRSFARSVQYGGYGSSGYGSGGYGGMSGGYGMGGYGESAHWGLTATAASCLVSSCPVMYECYVFTATWC